MRLRSACLILITALALNGCSLGYLTNSAWQQTKLLWRRTPIGEAQQSSELTEPQRLLLSTVPDVRAFASETLKLDVGDAYSTFAAVPKEALSWVMMGARKDRFELKTWWFPIVGTVPYKGFGSREDAEAAARELADDGYETWVRPAGAYSTLGWFNDPIVSSMLEGGELALTNTVIHELSHRTFWISNDVAFNETAANVIGTLGAVQYYQGADYQRANYQRASAERFAAACSELNTQRDLASGLNELYLALSALYTAASPTVLTERDLIFANWRAQYPQLSKRWATLNNARLMQARLYYTRFDDLLSVAQDLTIPVMISELKRLEGSPWEWLDSKLALEGNASDANICG